MDPSPHLVSLLQPCLASPRDCAMLLDLDGTLAPIVEHPSDVRLLDGMHEVLLELRAGLGLLGFVSGRRLSELERIVGLDGCAYSGNHGMEVHRRGEAPRVARAAEAYLPRLHQLVTALPAEALAAGGVWLEDKGPTLTLHYRTAPDQARARDLLAREVEPAAAALGLVTAPGRMSLEVRPPVALNKGTAVRELIEGAPIACAISIGDDRTDAHAWSAIRELRAEGALRRAVAVAVGNPEVPEEVLASADARVEGIEGVLGLLRHAADHVAAPERSPTSSAKG